MKLLIVYEILLLTACFGADFIQSFVASATQGGWILALIDNFAHGVIAFLSWCVVVQAHRTSDFLTALVCGLASCAIDVDHFVAAKSFRLSAATRLKTRPPFHATIPFVLFSSCFILVDFHQHRKNWLFLFLGPVLLISVVSHHLRDAIRRGIWLWPLFPHKHTSALPYPLAYLITLAFPLVISKLMNLDQNPVLPLAVVFDV